MQFLQKIPPWCDKMPKINLRDRGFIGLRKWNLGVVTSQEKDSFLRLMKPVNYLSKRPVAFENPFIQLSAHPPSILQIASEATHKILHTKSIEWSYEEELRLAMPDEVLNGEYSLRMLCPPFFNINLKEHSQQNLI
jgi:hypothetical protein